ncbi:MAG: NAD-dependent epimerase/dehydratase family protein [Sphingobacteriaceae bacterium]|nr:MAG: NAD-dependent epimerase/dehydratase family protein [Sphingobacteriaceae bacterium]
MKHTILGANGTIATELIPVLRSHGEDIRLISRDPKPVAGATSVAADVLNYNQLLAAIIGSEVVYLLIGITYNAEVWRRDWPVIMRNVIDACKATGAKLIFFDDVYMYGKVDGIMTEETPYLPTSKKGKVRAEVAQMLLKEMAAGTIKAAIARAVDFYGPRVTDKSAASTLVFEKMKDGKAAQWFINADVPRSYNYTPDAAKALYLLATHERSFGQVWHLPSASPLTGRAFVKLAAKYMHRPAKVTVLPKWLLRIIGWFNPFMKEAYEMNYQDEFPFHFSSAKFEKAFNFIPTPYEVGVQTTAAWHLKQ